MELQSFGSSIIQGIHRRGFARRPESVLEARWKIFASARFLAKFAKRRFV